MSTSLERRTANKMFPRKEDGDRRLGFVTGARWQKQQPPEITDDMIERGARALGALDPGEDWEVYDRPTSPAGDEYHSNCIEQVKEIIAAMFGKDDES